MASEPLPLIETFAISMSAEVIWWRSGIACLAITTDVFGPPMPAPPVALDSRNTAPNATMASTTPTMMNRRPPPGRGLAAAGATAKTKSPPMESS
ncbi:MAG: hypothetical protein AUI15_10905 [Actinobacteria bacterium 13_2_20CM_2_66_6]|nr:MAG: hypothetical protein AUI15_10905 [Actinobacteria bacterium 13_2_20CM_2_66_6]